VRPSPLCGVGRNPRAHRVNLDVCAGTARVVQMTHGDGSAARSAPPEAMLRKATLAADAALRAKYARRGLTHPGCVDRTMRSMLLRQLYLAHMEARRFDDALSVAEEMIGLEVMPDVARQDAARACLGLHERERAVEHLRLASRVSPACRRAFHLWTLGSVLYLADRPREAVGALSRAVRWGTTDKPLYQAQLLLARRAAGEQVGDLEEARERLLEAPCGQGYGQFVLGELAFHAGLPDAARDHLWRFVERSTGGRVALAVALEAEITRARSLLLELDRAKETAS
jgi:tetratricopeptide (TPR) repeat protein